MNESKGGAEKRQMEMYNIQKPNNKKMETVNPLPLRHR
jgi:hypothetical protein